MLENIIRSLISCTSDSGMSPEYLKGWIESELGKDAGFIFSQIHFESFCK